MTLHEYIEQQILPRYAAFDKGHQRDHAQSVIQESLVLAKEHGADLDMAYTIVKCTQKVRHKTKCRLWSIH